LAVQSHSAAAHRPIQGRTRQRRAARVPRARQQCERLGAGARIWGRRVAADRKYPVWPALRLIKGVEQARTNRVLFYAAGTRRACVARVPGSG
jgi:hypothetical protein